MLNAAGGYVFPITRMQAVNRFLVLGTEGGTYYESEKDLTKQNLDNVIAAIQEDGEAVVNMILDVSDKGKAKKNDQALFALALCMKHGDAETKRAAESIYTRVARTGYHHLMFVDFIHNLPGRGWGNAVMRMVGKWYTEKTEDQLAYQITKYRHRNGWTHRDVLNLCHAGENTPLYRWMTNAGSDSRNLELWVNEGFDENKKPIITKRKREFAATESLAYPHILQGFLKAQEFANSQPDRANTSLICNLISDYGLTHEMIPNQFLKSKDVWTTLLQKMPLTACLRNLGRMTSLGVLETFSDNVQTVLDKFTRESVGRARLHPLSVLVGQRTYESGKGLKGSLSWSPNNRVLSVLEDAFYWGFDSIKPTGKKILLALDTSGSMFASWYGRVPIASCPNLYCGEIAAVIAMVTARCEPNHVICAFDDEFATLPITDKMSLQEVMKIVRNRPHGGTDCSLPMTEAYSRGWRDIDAFVIYTDNESWAGNQHAYRAAHHYNDTKEKLTAYRDTVGIPSKMITVSMTASDTSIVEPDVDYMMDVVGMSTDTPRTVSMFISGEI